QETLRNLRDNRRRKMAELENVARELADERMRSVEGGSGVGRRPAAGGRGGRAGTAFDIIAGVGAALLSDNSGRISQLEDQARWYRNKLADLSGRISGVEQNVRRMHSEFNAYQCYNLGYRHEVLNIRCSEPTVQLQHF
ncbi:MAG: hypothetical protein AAF709_08985, partial [Pseudomonadota bacterium]